MSERALLITNLLAYWFVAITYIGFNTSIPYPMNAIFKAFPAVLLAVSLINMSVKYKRLLIGGFIFCALGDLLLALLFEHNFVVGLLAFLVAHLLFTTYFLRYREWHKRKLRLIGVGTLLMLVAATLVLPKTGAMLWPVSAYMLVIFSMAMTAILVEPNNPSLMTGVFLFMFSDLLIGINRFVYALPFESILIMFTYYAALFLMFRGITAHPRVTEADA